MSKETWSQFRDRVKPAEGQKFIDDLGQWWAHRNGDFVHEKNGIYLGEDGFGKILSCSLLDAIEHVEKPKLKKVTLYGYVSIHGFFWSCGDDLDEVKALDENGQWMTEVVLVEDND